MKFAAFAKLAAVAGVLMASVFGQALSVQAGEGMDFGQVDIRADYQTVAPQTRFFADMDLAEDGNTTGTVEMRSGDFNMWNSNKGFGSAALVCEGSNPVVIVNGTYTKMINGRVVAQSSARFEFRNSASGGGPHVKVFNGGDVYAMCSFRVVGTLNIETNPCR